MVRLGDVATYINGYAFKPSDWSDNGLPIIRIQNLTGNDYETNYYSGDYDKKYEVNNGDVLISWSASLGVYEWKNDKALLNQHIFKVQFDKLSVDKNYFIHTITYLLNDMAKETHGSTMKHITKPRFDNTLFPYPSLQIQREISQNLDKVTHLIDLCNQILDKLDLLVKSRFVEMFGEIHNSSKYHYKPVSSFTQVISGGTPNRDVAEYWENGTIPWVKTTELKNDIIIDAEEYITDKGLQDSSAKIVPPNTILIAMYGQGKTRGMTAYLSIEASTNQACACILPSKNMNQLYLWQYFILSYEKLRSMAKGGNQPNLNGNIIKNFPVLLPPIELQNQFAAFVEQTDKSKLAVKKVLEKASTLKKALMQEYFG